MTDAMLYTPDPLKKGPSWGVINSNSHSSYSCECNKRWTKKLSYMPRSNLILIWSNLPIDSVNFFTGFKTTFCFLFYCGKAKSSEWGLHFVLSLGLVVVISIVTGMSSTAVNWEYVPQLISVLISLTLIVAVPFLQTCLLTEIICPYIFANVNQTMDY